MNYRSREVTIFLQNSVPVKFLPGEHKVLSQEGLEKQYGSYLRRTDLMTEGKNKEVKKTEKGLINEVKQPAADKELTKEPVTEESKSKRKVVKEGPKLSEGYSPFQTEQTIASTGGQEK